MTKDFEASSLTLEEAEIGLKEQDLPIGAILVIEDKIVDRGTHEP